MYAPLRSDGQYCSRKCRERVYRLEKKKLRVLTEWIGWFDEEHDPGKGS